MPLTFAIGDIHGEKAKMSALLAKIEAEAEGDTIVFIGDYIDRGPASAAVLDRLIAGPPEGWRWVVLPGNHEMMMLDALLGRGSRTTMEQWLFNGGETTLKSYPDGEVSTSHLEFVGNLHPLYRDRHRIFAHAWYDGSKAFEEQDEEALLWERFSSRDRLKSIAPWHFVHGHTPGAGNPTTRGNRTNIDSGAVFGGPLSAVVFDDEKPGPPIRIIQAM